MNANRSVVMVLGGKEISVGEVIVDGRQSICLCWKNQEQVQPNVEGKF